jgi:hypothetical protein
VIGASFVDENGVPGTRSTGPLHFLDKVLGYNLSSLEVLEFQVVLHSLLTLLLKWL